MPTSRNIPEPMKRLIRQRCGFGCVVCGLPLYEYEHLLGWANVKRHIASEITLLCDRHHREKTNELLPLAEVKACDANPFNKRAGVSKPYDLHFSGSEYSMILGGFKVDSNLDQMVAICVDGIPLLGFSREDGHLLLHVRLLDRFNNLMLQIDSNQLVYAPSTWDIQLQGRRLCVRESARSILLDIKFEVPNRISINRGDYCVMELRLQYLAMESPFSTMAGRWITAMFETVTSPWR